MRATLQPMASLLVRIFKRVGSTTGLSHELGDHYELFEGLSWAPPPRGGLHSRPFFVILIQPQ